MASPRPTRRATCTVSGRLTLPISFRFILDGLGNLSIHSGTVEPDCRMTLAILDRKLDGDANAEKQLWVVRFQEWAVFVSEIGHGFTLTPHTTGTT